MGIKQFEPLGRVLSSRFTLESHCFRHADAHSQRFRFEVTSIVLHKLCTHTFVTVTKNSFFNLIRSKTSKLVPFEYPYRHF